MTKKAKNPVTEVKTAEVKAAEVKAAVAETPAVEVKAPAQKEETVKAAKKSSRKSASRAPKVKTAVILEYQGRQMVEADLVEQAKKLWAESGKTEAIKELNMYVKPEDGAVYCVINGETMGSFEL